MCGIFYCLFKDGRYCKQNIEHLTHIVEPLIRRRGPDSFNTKEKLLFDHESGQPFKLLFMGAVLHLRGSPTPQPLEDNEGNVLIWNGEVFDGINIPEEGNDTSVLSHLLGNHSNTDSHILSIMSCIQGPWSFVYYQPKEGKLWFGRDYFGRRSLIWHLPRDDDDIMAVSSAAERRDEHSDLSLVWEEVPANGIYCLETKPQMASQNHLVKTFKFNHFRLKRYSWTLDPKSIHSSDDIYTLQAPVKAFNKELPSESDMEELENKHRKQNQTNGLRENAQCHSSSLANSDLDMSTSHRIDTLEELCNKAILSAHNSGELTASCKKDNNFESVPETWKTSTSVGLPESFISVLGEAVRKRIFNLPRLNYKSERHLKQTCEEEELLQLSTNQDFHGKNEFADGRVGVLFSGGIDSIVLTALADRYVPKTEPIDLINVAFEQKVLKQNPTSRRKPKPANPEPKPSNFEVPDRLTGKKGVLELSTINPDRQWNFIEVNVNLKDLQQARSEHITHLVSPLNSVLDDSIGCALWFAARGSGVLRCPRCIMGAEDNSRECVHPHEYTSKAKVLLVGMGADEQLGGYARHRTKFSQQGWLGLVEEMEMEVNRISERNLGRDDRCISDHGREARFPFLDEQVVSFLSALPVWLKADLRLPRGTGEKILLRQAAKLLGLTSSAVLPKRAIQFGSRIAKLEGTTEKGSDTCSRLKLN